jgi:hypothetical protein
LWKTQGKWWNGESPVLLNLLFHCMHQIFINHRRSSGSSCIFLHPSLKCLTHLLTTESLMACSPYTSQSWRMSAGFLFLAFKKRITGRISHVVGFSIFLNIVNTQDDAWTWFTCLQMASVPSKRTNKLCTPAHHSGRSAAMAIFANGTYFVDTPHIFLSVLSY